MENLMNISWTLPISLSYVSFIQLNGYIVVSDCVALGLEKPLRICPPVHSPGILQTAQG